MAPRVIDFASSLAESEDVPRTAVPKDTPNWSESFGHWGYFPEQKLGLFVHNQRHVDNPSLWREIIVIQRGDGSVMVAKSYGTGQRGGSPGANGLAVTCIKPFEEWVIEFDGAARIVSSESLWREQLRDGVHEAVKMSLRLSAFAPVWAMDKNANAESWGRAHYEQGVRIKGRIESRDGVVDIDGLGWRDHSYGTRDFADGFNAQWMHGQFASGRCFLVMCTDPNSSGPGFETAFVVDDGIIYKAKLRSFPPIECPVPGRTAAIELDYERGSARIECTYLRAIPVSLAGTNEQVIGRIGGADGWSKVYFDTHLRYEWDGETGYGCANPTTVR